MLGTITGLSRPCHNTGLIDRTFRVGSNWIVQNYCCTYSFIRMWIVYMNVIGIKAMLVDRWQTE